jgi:putative inorganic carbon (hco3(-)) transporter
MRFPKAKEEHLLLAVAIAAAGLIQVSIAASQTLLGLGILLTLLLRRKLEFPRIWLPLLLSLLWTIAADVLSPDPWTGRAQIKKYFVWLLLPLLYGVFRRQLAKANILILLWTATATASGLLGLFQFVKKVQHAQATGEDFYLSYLARRITGFESHWMTFGALQLAMLSIVLAHLFFSDRKFSRWVYASLPVFSIAIALGWTRSIWLATVPAVLYLVWCWRPKMTVLLPPALLLVIALASGSTRDRLLSLVHPHGDNDSNRHRLVTFRTGVAMIEAHPVFGLGPEEIGRQFNAYVPFDIARPLPTGYYGHLHNIYVQYAAERGIPGLLLILLIIGQMLADCFAAIRRLNGRPSQELFLLHSTVAVTIGILVGGLFEYNLGDSEVLMMFVSVVALGYAAVAHVTGRSATDSYPGPGFSATNHPSAAYDEPRPLGVR